MFYGSPCSVVDTPSIPRQSAILIVITVQSGWRKTWFIINAICATGITTVDFYLPIKSWQKEEQDQYHKNKTERQWAKQDKFDTVLLQMG